MRKPSSFLEHLGTTSKKMPLLFCLLKKFNHYPSPFNGTMNKAMTGALDDVFLHGWNQFSQFFAPDNQNT
jgi:hypothetical protein